MIRLTIQRKVFLAIFALATTLVVVLALVMRWNLEQGFERYTSAAELARLDWLIRNLESEYSAHGSWEFLRQSPEKTWRQLSRPNPRGGYNLPQQDTRPRRNDELAEAPDKEKRTAPPPWQDERPSRNDDTDRPQPPGIQSGTPPRPEGSGIPGAGGPSSRLPPANDLLRIGPRLALFDAEGKFLVGNSNTRVIGAERAISHQGKVVGQLHLDAVPASADQLDAAFLSSQTRNMALAGLAALVLSMLASWGLARHLLAPIRDVTDGARRIADEELDVRIPVRRDDELGELAGNFNLMAERLGEIEASRRAWISDASHELRTPLAVLRAEIEALQDGIREPDEETLSRLHKQVQQLAKLVDDLRRTLDQAPGAGVMERILFSPIDVLDETIDAFRERYLAAEINIDIAGSADTRVQVRGDAGRLTQVFTNVLENTLRYTESGGQLRITVGTKGQRLTLQFDDTAPAPPRSAMPRLFDRFFRAEPSRSRAHGGSGLGLAICKALVEAHGGTIRANLSDLGGLSLVIELPLEKS